MKYKVGDKVLVKVKIIDVDDNGYYAIPINGNFTFWVEDKSIVENTDMTAEEAWDISGKLVYEYFNNEEFGGNYKSSYDLITKFSPQEAKDKIESLEA